MGAVITLLTPEQQRQQGLWWRTAAARKAFATKPTVANETAAVEAHRAFLEAFVGDNVAVASIGERFQSWLAGFRDGWAA